MNHDAVQQQIAQYVTHHKIEVEMLVKAADQELLEQIFAKAIDVFENKQAAISWLIKPNEQLDDARPIAYADDSERSEKVIKLLGRIEHGIPC